MMFKPESSRFYRVDTSTNQAGMPWSMEGASGFNSSETIMKGLWPVKVGRVNSW